jgi:tape measure domain-containing protein
VANTLATLKVLIQAQAQGVEQALGRTQEAIKSFMSGMQATSRAAASAQRSAQAMESFSQATQRAGAAARTAAPQIQSLSSSLQQVHKTAATVAEEMVDLGGIFSTMSTRIGRVMLITLEFGVALKALQAAGAVFGTWRESVFGLNASLELLQIRLTTLYGSVEKANQVLSFLITLAAKSPYGIQDLAKALNYLAAAGAPAEALPRILTAIVNITAAFGGSADVFERVSLALFQMAQRGKVVGEEMRQLTNAGIPAWQILAETIGVSIAQAMDMVEKRQVDAQTFIEGLVAWSEGRLGDMSNAIMRTWTGAVQAVQEGIQFFLAQGFQPLFQAFRDALVEIGNFVSSDTLLVEWAARVNGAVQVVVAGLYGFVGVLRDVLYEAASVALSLGQAIYEALQWINPFARHSPSLVEDVEGGIDQIVDAFGDLEDIQGNVDAIRRQIRLLQIELRTMQMQLRDVEAQLRRERKILDEYRENLRRVTDRIREIESAIRDLARVQLAEELPYLDQLKQYDREIKRLRLQKLRLEFSGVPAAFIDELATKIEILSKRAEMVDLERELNVGPLKEQLEAAADAALGLNQAMSFGEALSRISELTAELVNLRTEQEYWQNLVEQQEAVVAALEEQADALRNAMDELRNAIDQLRNQLAEFQNESARSRDELEKLKVPAIGVAGAFSILHRAIQDVATTPFVVDTSGLDSLAKRSADAEEVLRRATAVMESILPDAASKSAMEVREFARQIAAASAGTDDFKDAVKDYGSALDDARAALQEQQSVLREYERLLRDVESAIRDTERAIRDLTEVPLAEEQPYIEQLKELEKQIKQLELRKVELILAGAPEEQIKGVENEIRRLEAQAKKVDLERELKVEPLREQLRKMADEALDTGKVLTFAEAQQAMIAHIENLKKLREEHTRIAEATERQRDLVEEWSKKVEALAAGYDALRESIQKVGKEAQEPAMGATTQWSFADPSVFQQAEEQRKKFEKIASETRQRIEEALKPLAPFLTEAAGLVSRFVVTAAALGVAFLGVRTAMLPFTALLQNLNVALAPAIAYNVALAKVLSGQVIGAFAALIPALGAAQKGFMAAASAMGLLVYGATQRAAEVLYVIVGALRAIAGATATGQLQATLKKIITTLSQFGQTVKKVYATAIATIRNFLALVPKIQGAVANIFGTLRTALGTIAAGGWSAILGAITGWLSQLGGLATKEFSAVTTAIGNFLALFPKIQGAVGSVFGALRTAIGAIAAGNWVSALNTIVGWLKTFGGAVSTAFSAAVGAIRSFPQTVTKAFSTVINAISSFVKSIPGIQRAAKAIVAAWHTVVGVITSVNWLTVLGGVVGWFTRIGQVAGGVASGFGSLVGIFMSVLNPIKALSAGLGVLQLGFAALKAPMLIVTGLFQGLFGGFWGLVNLVTLVWQAFSQNWFGIRDIFVPVAKQILEGLQAIQQAFSEQGLAGGIRTLFDVGGDILKSIGGAFLQLGQNIMTAIQQVDWSAVGKTISDGLSTLGTALIEMGTKLWNKLTEIDWGAVASKAIDLLANALTAIAAPVDRFLTWLVNLFVSIDWGQVAQQAQDALLTAWSALTLGLDRLYQWLVDTFNRIDWGAIARTIGDLLVAVLSTEVKLIGAVLNWFASIDWQQVAQDAATALATAWSVVTGVAERIAEWFGKLFDQVNWGEVAQTAGDALASAWGALTGGAEHLFNWLKNLIGGIDWGGLADEARRRLGEALGELRSAVVAGALDPEKSLGPLQKPLETLFRVFEENRGTIETAIGFIKDMLAPAFDSIKQAITDTVGVIRDQLGPTWQQIKETFSAVAPVLGVIAGVIGGALLVAFRLLAESVQILLPLIVKLFFEGIQAGLRIIEGAANVIMGFVNIVVGLFTGDWQRAWDGAKQILEGFKEAVLGILDGLIGSLAAIFGKIWDVITGIFQKIYDWLVGHSLIPDLVEKIISIITGLRDRLVGFWQNILDAVINFWTSIKDAVVGKVTELVAKGKDLVSDLRIALEERWNAILTKVQEIWEGIKTFVSEKVTGLKETALNVITEARDRLAGLWDEIKQKATTIWDELKRHFENAKQALLDALKWPFEQLRDTAARIWDEVWNKATTIWDQLKRFFENLKQGMYDALEWPFKAFRDNIESILGAAYNFAIAPINALIDAFNAVERAIAAALRWIGEKLGIDFLRNIYWTDIPRIPGYSGGGGRGGGGVRAYAEGTDYHPGGLALVGEEGPELVVLPRGAKVLPADVTARFMQQAVDAPGFKPIGGVIDTIVSTVSSIVGTAAEILEEWLSKGAEWVVSQLSSFFNIDTSGWAGSIASALRERVLGWIRDFVSELLKKLEPKLDDKWYRPLDHYTVTQEFGYTEYAKSGAYGGGPHTGIDLAAARGTPVYAARRGTVTFAGSSAGGYGNLIILAHKGDLTTYYAHLERILVSVGQQVAGKQQIGTVDSTGYSTGDHLHFEIREHGIPVDPRKYIAFGTGGLLREPVIGAGLLSGSRYLFAERGPEYVVPVRDIAAAGAVGGGIDVDINFHGPVTINAHDEEQVNRVVHDIGYLIAQELRRRGLR